ncbi:MAG: metal-sulfur cluster assembly factor [Limosilactobacillus pontis]|uniref:DNA methyltransferase n=1 Tax=Limosilactobacillus pontis TaxID=35787 RepID=A0A2J6NMC8_9LACO|nr:metal-sulfur cluster assembly factor [Limosilactobacillus pontis]PMB82471.1 DNA methyltransferase [Limosilactobacillus pontis]
MADEEAVPFSPIENKVMDALEKVIDPELGIDLVNLGLIYDVKVDDDGNCTVTMTLTTMGCPLGDVLNEKITAAVMSVDGVTSCKINLVWEPVWDISRMSRFAKIALGIHG